MGILLFLLKLERVSRYLYILYIYHNLFSRRTCSSPVSVPTLSWNGSIEIFGSKMNVSLASHGSNDRSTGGPASYNMYFDAGTCFTIFLLPLNNSRYRMITRSLWLQPGQHSATKGSWD